MIGKIKGIHSPDTSELESFHPDNADNFSILIQVLVGTDENEGGESFDFIVCTSDWLKEKYRGEIAFLRNLILVDQFNYEDIKNRIEKLVQSISGNDWNDYAVKLSRYGAWEFEDYRD